MRQKWIAAALCAAVAVGPAMAEEPPPVVFMAPVAPANRPVVTSKMASWAVPPSGRTRYF